MERFDCGSVSITEINQSDCFIAGPITGLTCKSPEISRLNVSLSNVSLKSGKQTARVLPSTNDKASTTTIQAGQVCLSYIIYPSTKDI